MKNKDMGENQRKQKQKQKQNLYQYRFNHYIHVHIFLSLKITFASAISIYQLIWRGFFFFFKVFIFLFLKTSTISYRHSSMVLMFPLTHYSHLTPSLLDDLILINSPYMTKALHCNYLMVVSNFGIQSEFIHYPLIFFTIYFLVLPHRLLK